jgi:hypothetical protein
MTHVATYLNGLFIAVSLLMQFSKQLVVHWLTYMSRMSTLLSRMHAGACCCTCLHFAICLVLQHRVYGFLDDVADIISYERSLPCELESKRRIASAITTSGTRTSSALLRSSILCCNIQRGGASYMISPSHRQTASTTT